jgi:hypothetical protein
MLTREFDLGSPRLKVPCIYTTGVRYLHVKNYTKGEIVQYMNQTIEVQYRRNVGGTIERQDRSDCAITDRS